MDVMKRKTTRDNRIYKIRDMLVKRYKPEKVILFGSRAYGKPKHYSDYDLFVVKKTKRRELDRMREVSNIFTPRDFSLDVLVSTPSELKKRLAMGDFFYEEILDKGKVLYEKR
jgi:predicted nucleotidyltransferase